MTTGMSCVPLELRACAARPDRRVAACARRARSHRGCLSWRPPAPVRRRRRPRSRSRRRAVAGSVHGRRRGRHRRSGPSDKLTWDGSQVPAERPVPNSFVAALLNFTFCAGSAFVREFPSGNSLYPDQEREPLISGDTSRAAARRVQNWNRIVKSPPTAAPRSGRTRSRRDHPTYDILRPQKETARTWRPGATAPRPNPRASSA